MQRQPKKPGKYWASSGRVLGARPEGIILALFKTLAHPHLEPFVQFWSLYLKKDVVQLNIFVCVYIYTKNDLRASASALQGHIKGQGLKFGEQKAVRGYEQRCTISLRE